MGKFTIYLRKYLEHPIRQTVCQMRAVTITRTSLTMRDEEKAEGA